MVVLRHSLPVDAARRFDGAGRALVARRGHGSSDALGREDPRRFTSPALLQN
jgi:hypothetical protein